MQWQQRMKGQDDELRHVEGLKNRKMEQQYEMMKGSLLMHRKRSMSSLREK